MKFSFLAAFVCLFIFAPQKASGSPLGEAVIKVYGDLQPETKLVMLELFERILEDTSLTGDEEKQKEIKRDYEIIKEHFLSEDQVPFIVNGPNGLKAVPSNIQPFIELVTMQIPNYKEWMSPSEIDSEDIRNEYIKLLNHINIYKVYMTEQSVTAIYERTEKFNALLKTLEEKGKSEEK